MISYWEQSALLDYDLIVIGGGITGLFCALSYRKNHPKAKIAVIERGMFSSGASTKNAGFACFGSLSELEIDLNAMGEEKLLQLVEMRWNGLQLLRQTLGDAAIEFQQQGGYELFFESKPKTLDQIEAINQLLYPLFKKSVFVEAPHKISTFGFRSNHVKQLVENPFEGQIHTGKMMRALLSKVSTQDISYFSNTEVTHFDQGDKNKILLHLKNQTFNLKCDQLAVCNNAFAKQFFPELNLNPGRGMVMLTKPIKELKIKGCFHYKQGYYYFRNHGDQLLFGGGREQDFKTETTTEFGINPIIKAQLEHDLNTFLLPEQKTEIAMQWSGIMAFGENKQPIIKKINDNVAVGVRLGGMGVAIGSKIGRATAALLEQ